MTYTDGLIRLNVPFHKLRYGRQQNLVLEYFDVVFTVLKIIGAGALHYNLHGEFKFEKSLFAYNANYG